MTNLAPLTWVELDDLEHPYNNCVYKDLDLIRVFAMARRSLAAQAAVTEAQIANSILFARYSRVGKALNCFLNDTRFVVSVGGNPNVVDKMLADARAALTEATDPQPDPVKEALVAREAYLGEPPDTTWEQQSEDEREAWLRVVAARALAGGGE